MPDPIFDSIVAETREIEKQFAAEIEAVRIVTGYAFCDDQAIYYNGINTRQDIVNCAFNVRELGARIRRNGGLVYVY